MIGLGSFRGTDPFSLTTKEVPRKDEEPFTYTQNNFESEEKGKGKMEMVKVETNEDLKINPASDYYRVVQLTEDIF